MCAMMCEKLTEEDLLKLDLTQYIGQKKIDGSRIELDGNKLYTQDRKTFMRANEVSWKFPELVLPRPINAVIDGEVCAEDGDFLSTASRIQSKDALAIKIGTQKNPVIYWMFDIRSVAGKDVTKYSLLDRLSLLKAAARTLATDNPRYQVLPWYTGRDILWLWQEVKKANEEGIILKKIDSLYENKRSHSWVKLKYWKESIEKVESYEEMPNDKGITLNIKSNGQRLACLGGQAEAVRQHIAANKSVNIEVQWLSKNKDGVFRFPSFRGLVA